MGPSTFDWQEWCDGDGTVNWRGGNGVLSARGGDGSMEALDPAT